MKFYGKNTRLGVLGGGQLGRMLIQEAINMDVHVSVLDPAPNAPCSEIANEFTVGDLHDFDAVYAFGKDKDVITIEIEHVNVEALFKLEEEGKKVFPQPRVLQIVQDKGLQKNFYKENNIPTSPYFLLDSPLENQEKLQAPFVQKSRKGGYDGKGVFVVKSTAQYADLFPVPSVIEELVDIEKELAVIVSRNEKGQVKAFPTVELTYNEEANLVEFLLSPARIEDDIDEKACDLAVNLIEKLEMVGLLAVELFLTKSGDILVNEIAPRPHNSGHHSIEGNYTSQYMQHLRSILGLPPGDTDVRCPAVMLNLLGAPGFTGPVHYEGIDKMLSGPRIYPHIYGKTDTKPFRKMGHVTVLDDTLEQAIERAEWVKENVIVKT